MVEDKPVPSTSKENTKSAPAMKSQCLVKPLFLQLWIYLPRLELVDLAPHNLAGLELPVEDAASILQSLLAPWLQDTCIAPKIIYNSLQEKHAVL